MVGVVPEGEVGCRMGSGCDLVTISATARSSARSRALFEQFVEFFLIFFGTFPKKRDRRSPEHRGGVMAVACGVLPVALAGGGLKERGTAS